MIRTYTELIRLHTFEDRFYYLRLTGVVGDSTFGHDRYLNQKFYRSKEWKDVRRHVLYRDGVCDLALEGHEIQDRPIIHHMNPLIQDDIVHGTNNLMNPEFLITVTHNTHNAIHYGDAEPPPQEFVERKPGDTKLW